MGIFGWSYPPGCNSVPGDEPDPPCEVCGGHPDICICPECPVCHVVGDPACYDPARKDRHGLVRNQDQIEGMAILEKIQKDMAEAEQFWAEQIEQERQDHGG
jgi:hypothetical protein